MPTPLELLSHYWGHAAFRPMQAEIIDSVLSGRDTLALLPTGGGKSVCFQVPGLAREGLTLVISPLIALMKDQVERLNRMGIAATYVNSAMAREAIDHKLEGAATGVYRFLYLAPERIHSEVFLMRLPRMQVSLLVVDEAHCISQWGYDFRPSYLEINRIREVLPQIPIIALTASATPAVQQDIVQQLAMRDPQVFASSFRRDNLRYFVLEEENAGGRVLDICRRAQGTGIVYVRTRKLAERLARMLQEQGLTAAAYHGGMKNTERSTVQQDWLEDRKRIIVATNAFGMGIDKPDVRWVVHYNLPFDLESYYQEAGRGGRDGKTALAIALRSTADLHELKRWSRDKYPTWEALQQHYHLVCQYYKVPNQGSVDLLCDLSMPDLSQACEVPAMTLYHSLRILHQAGVLYLNEDNEDFAHVMVVAHPDEVWRFRQAHPLLEPVVDFLLRSLGGEVYTQEVRFLPDLWARKLDLPPLELHYTLDRLARHGLISYQPATDRPTLRFMRPHRRLNKADVGWDKIEFLRAQSEQRLAALLHYVGQTETCRSVLIQQYFGEADVAPCGVCDVCTGRFKRKAGAFDELCEAILAYVGQGGHTYRQVVTEIAIGSADQREEVLRYLIDKAAVMADSTGNLSLGT
ncbi:MAG: RecQ family ATP-dependent DNA helicase [Bacteroidia bacterium]